MSREFTFESGDTGAGDVISNANAIAMHPPSSPLTYTHPSNMALVSNDPSWWPYINSYRSFSYFAVSGSAAVIYDYVLTFGQEIELIWRQRWSIMTVLYLGIRYIGILYAAMFIIGSPSVPMPDTWCNIIDIATNWTDVAIAAMLGVIVIARLHAMYQGSGKMLTFLIVIFLAVNIACVVLTAIGLKNIVGEVLILSGTYACGYIPEGNSEFLSIMVWILSTVWEVLTLCLSLWIAVKHFRDLRQLGPSTGSIIGDMFTVLIKSHVLYFASFAAVACLQLAAYSPNISESSKGSDIYNGALQILLVVQMFVLGPRLILSVREYHAKLVAGSDAATCMASIAFQEHHVHVSTSSTV